MDLITDEFLSARTREPLEARLRKSDKFQQHMKSLHKASQAFTKDTDISKKDWKLYAGWKKNGLNTISHMGRNPTVWDLKME